MNYELRITDYELRTSGCGQQVISALSHTTLILFSCMAKGLVFDDL